MKEISHETSHFNLNLFLTMYQIKKLKQFTVSINDSDAAILIQEATDILSNMFVQVEQFKPEDIFEKFSRVVITMVLDPRVQIALFITITASLNFFDNYFGHTCYE